jgi:predicted Zn-dependent protease
MNIATTTTLRLVRLALLLVLGLALASGTALAQRGKKDDKEPLYPNATREEPDLSASQRIGPKLQDLQDAYFDEKYDEALELAAEIIGNKRANEYEKAFAAQVSAHVWVDRDDYAKAIGHLQQALEFNGLPNDQHYQIMYQVSQMQLAEERYAEALETLNRFLAETRTEDPKYYAMQGNAHYRLEQYPEAEKALKKAVEMAEKPDESWLQLLMAVYFETDRMDQAATVAEQLLARNPDDKTLVRNLSSIYLQAEQNDKAAKVLEDAKARGMLTDSADYEQLYKLYYYIEQEDKAVATINEGLEKGILTPTPEIYRVLGDAYYFSERIPQALEAYTAGSKVAEDGMFDFLRARILTELERHKEAKAAAQQALERGVKQPGNAYLVLGAAELGLDNKGGAVAAYKQAAKYPESKTIAETWLRQSGQL